jgi:Dak1 domain
MTRLFNDPATFTEDMLDGFLDANARYVVGVEGGVVRATTTPPGKVAVVIGGGSGHYPAFCGVVGQGFADGAVVGRSAWWCRRPGRWRCRRSRLGYRFDPASASAAKVAAIGEYEPA